jgi:flagellar secretion chaperone FliS
MIYAPRMSPAKAQGHYLDTDLASRIECASPHALITLLYDQLEEALSVIAIRLAKGGAVGQDPHSRRAQSILIALQAGLDLDKGGDVAQALSGIYRAMTVELTRVVGERDGARLDCLRDGVSQVANAWRAIAQA